MKPKKLTLISLTLLATLLIGTVFVLSIHGNTLIADQVKIMPKPLDLENPDSVTVQVKVFRDGVSVVDQINASTVRLEGYMTTINNWTTKAPPNFYAQFDGTAVANCIISKISHMGITRPHPKNPVRIPLKITGKLYDGTPWEGTGEAKVYVPDIPPPPP